MRLVNSFNLNTILINTLLIKRQHNMQYKGKRETGGDAPMRPKKNTLPLQRVSTLFLVAQYKTQMNSWKPMNLLHVGLYSVGYLKNTHIFYSCFRITCQKTITNNLRKFTLNSPNLQTNKFN